MPGVFNGISAVSAHKAGARALYLSGAGITNATLGMPDIAVASLTEFAQQAAYVTQAAPVPVLADADTGFGEALQVARTVIEMERAGLAGIHLEDQQNPKRCGHLDGKSLEDPETMARKIRAAVDSKRDSSFLIVARTDARGVEGLEPAISRAKRYVDAGADAVFPEGLEGEREFEAFRTALDVPLLANMTEFGKTPLISAQVFEQLGYQMVIFPMTAFRVMLKSLDETYKELIQAGTQRGLMELMRTRAELYDRIDYAEYEALDQKWAGNVEEEKQ
jgi:methylisocitrate lyase